MGKYSGIILFSDFDGTLFYGKKKEASKENADAIRYFQKNGGRFTLATGRYPNILDRYADRCNGIRVNAPMIAGNGCIVYDHEAKKQLFSANVTSDLTPLVFEAISRCPNIKYIDFFPQEPWSSIRVEKDDAESITSIMNNSPHKMYFTLILDDEHPEIALKQSDESRAIFDSVVDDDSYQVFRASIAGIEILPKGVSKGSHVRNIARSLGCDTVVCVGDYENDAAMIKEADIGYAMGNSHPSLFAVADRIAPRVEDHAIAKIISEL